MCRRIISLLICCLAIVVSIANMTVFASSKEDLTLLNSFDKPSIGDTLRFTQADYIKLNDLAVSQKLSSEQQIEMTC
jgi:hypothetical protein